MASSTTRANQPAEVYLWEDGKPEPRALTSHNAPLVSQLDLPASESFTFEGADDDKVQGFLLKPPGLRPGQEVSRSSS